MRVAVAEIRPWLTRNIIFTIALVSVLTCKRLVFATPVQLLSVTSTSSTYNRYLSFTKQPIDFGRPI